MVDFPNIDRTTLLIIINALGAIGAVTFIAAISFGVVQPSLSLYVGVGITWVVVLIGAVFLFRDGNQ